MPPSNPKNNPVILWKCIIATTSKDGEKRRRDEGNQGMSTKQIKEEVVDLKGELFMVRLQQSTSNEFKSSEFHRIRKRIVRMLSVKREREIEEGINKRLSRKFDHQWKKSIVMRPPPSLKKLQKEEAIVETEQST